MYNKRHVALAVACSMLLAPVTGNAATVSKQSGAVLFNEGNGFSPIDQRAELAPGTQIMVQPGGLASIAYANCTVRVGSGVWTVQAAAPCTNGATEIDFTQRMNQTGPDGGTGVGLVVIGGATATILGVGAIMSANNRRSPASP